MSDDKTSLAAPPVLAQARRLMAISALTTSIAVAAVLGVIGYRVFRSGESASAEASLVLPKGFRVVATTATGDHIVVTLANGDVTELRIFDVRSLRQTGRLRVISEP